jgi:hypothetical protein
MNLRGLTSGPALQPPKTRSRQGCALGYIKLLNYAAAGQGTTYPISLDAVEPPPNVISSSETFCNYLSLRRKFYDRDQTGDSVESA